MSASFEPYGKRAKTSQARRQSLRARGLSRASWDSCLMLALAVLFRAVYRFQLGVTLTSSSSSGHSNWSGDSRTCGNYRALKEVTVQVVSVAIAGSIVFFEIDLLRDYHQICASADASAKNAIVTYFGHLHTFARLYVVASVDMSFRYVNIDYIIVLTCGILLKTMFTICTKCLLC